MESSDSRAPGGADYLAPFETFQAYGLRGGSVYRGRIRADYASRPDELRRVLASAPGTAAVETIDGVTYATIRLYHGRRPPRRLWVHITLLLLTIMTTIGAGAEWHYGWRHEFAVEPFRLGGEVIVDFIAGEWSDLSSYDWPRLRHELLLGLPYAVALLFILLSHEMGHYLAARRYGIDSTLPFVIPAPFLFGTFGAVIKMRSPITHRRALFDVGVAGPIAGFIAGIIVLVIGLSQSNYGRLPAGPGMQLEFGDSLLIRFLAWLVLGPAPPGSETYLSPVAFAGWFGLFITFLNLMPLGQLDGGHVCYALFGKGQHAVGIVTFVGIILLGPFVALVNHQHISSLNDLLASIYPGWIMFALLVFLVIRVKHPPVMDSTIRLNWPRKLLGAAMILVFILIFIPIPVDTYVIGG